VAKGRGNYGYNILNCRSRCAIFLVLFSSSSRYFNSSLRNVACWGYWSGAGTYVQGRRTLARGVNGFVFLPSLPCRSELTLLLLIRVVSFIHIFTFGRILTRA
jgi:hypothetical protein